MNDRDKPLIRRVAAHFIYGVAAAITFGVAALTIDLSHIRTLALDSAHPVLVLGLFFFGLFVTFGSVGLAVGIMTLGDDD